MELSYGDRQAASCLECQVILDKTSQQFKDLLVAQAPLAHLEMMVVTVLLGTLEQKACREMRVPLVLLVHLESLGLLLTSHMCRLLARRDQLLSLLLVTVE